MAVDCWWFVGWGSAMGAVLQVETMLGRLCVVDIMCDAERMGADVETGHGRGEPRSTYRGREALTGESLDQVGDHKREGSGR